MAKKTKSAEKRKPKTSEETQEVAAVTESVESAPEADQIAEEVQVIESKVESKPEPKKEPEQPKMSLKDASRRFVIGYKEYWGPSIEKFAESHGFSGTGTVEECKEILRKWGAKVN